MQGSGGRVTVEVNVVGHPPPAKPNAGLPLTGAPLTGLLVAAAVLLCVIGVAAVRLGKAVVNTQH